MVWQDNPGPSISVYPSATSALLLLLGRLVMVLPATVVLFSGAVVPTVVGALGVLLLGAFALPAAALLLARAALHRPMLVADLHGVTDRSTHLAPGFVPWTAVRRVDTRTASLSSCLTIDVHHPDAPLRHGPSWLARGAMRINLAMGNSAINIPGSRLPISVDTLCGELRRLAELAELAQRPSPHRGSTGEGAADGR